MPVDTKRAADISENILKSTTRITGETQLVCADRPELRVVLHVYGRKVITIRSKDTRNPDEISDVSLGPDEGNLSGAIILCFEKASPAGPPRAVVYPVK